MVVSIINGHQPLYSTRWSLLHITSVEKLVRSYETGNSHRVALFCNYNRPRHGFLTDTILPVRMPELPVVQSNADTY